MKSPIARCLRTYRRVADKTYSCCLRCEIPIFAGDPYWGEVWVYSKHLFVKRYHDGCPIDPDEEERIMREIKEEIEKEEKSSQELDKAA